MEWNMFFSRLNAKVVPSTQIKFILFINFQLIAITHALIH